MQKIDKVFGVFFVDEKISSSYRITTDIDYKNSIFLGSVIIDEKEISTPLHLFKSIFCSKLNLPVPIRYNFLSSEGWPLTDDQEKHLLIQNVINYQNKTIAIKKTFDKTKIGIIESNKHCLGYICADKFIDLKELRFLINRLLTEINQYHQDDYIFIDRNGWPVLNFQENTLNLTDLMINYCICIKTKVLDHPYRFNSSFSVEDNQISFLNKKDSFKDVEKLDTELKRRSKTIIRTNTFYWKKNKSKKSRRKHIMISYARNEAADHAIKLKRSLVELGFNVYLDVHEIETGMDWQDALNEAVTECELFVPLITPMYGKTQWTNREIKLADILNKTIIPINFLKQWPPECLAIQFATTQYISWRPQESEHIESPSLNELIDIRQWPDSSIQQVSLLIAKQLPQLEEENSIPQKLSIFEKQSPMIKKSIVEELKQSSSSLIVISAHPDQKKLADELKNVLLQDNYEVWCSTDDLSDFYNDFSPNQIERFENEKNLLKLNDLVEDDYIERNSLLRYNEINDDFMKKLNYEENINRLKRPTSLPLVKNDISPFAKKSIVRLSSQKSEIFTICSLTPEKIEHLKQFQDKVANSILVIIIASDAYFRSTTSKNHIYYCEHRKKMLIIKSDNCMTPTWFSNLVGDENTIHLSNIKHLQSIKTKIKKKINSKVLVNPDNIIESRIQFYTKLVKKKIPKAAECCVYFVGSVNSLNIKTVQICKAIGYELAKIRNVVIVTSGFYGVGDLVGRSFNEKRSNSRTKSDSNVFHVLPLKDSKDFTESCKQTEEKSFEELDYGKTLFFGETMKERDKVVARLLNICILIGGNLETSYQAEEFIWNDHYVIPIVITGGAASGSYGLPVKIFKCPADIDEATWNTLADHRATPEQIAKSVCKIIIDLKKSILNHYYLRLEDNPSNKLKKSIKKKKSDKYESLDKNLVNDQESSQSSQSDKVLPVIEKNTCESRKSKWLALQKLQWLSKRK